MYYTMNAETAARIAADSARALACIEKVIVSTAKGGWRYTAVMNDGSTEVIRKLATRLYTAAHLHNCLVCSGKTGLGAVINFGQKPTSKDDCIKSYPVVVGGAA